MLTRTQKIILFSLRILCLAVCLPFLGAFAAVWFVVILFVDFFNTFNFDFHPGGGVSTPKAPEYLTLPYLINTIGGICKWFITGKK